MPTTDSIADRARAIREGTVVPGLLFRVTSEHLRNHCTARGDYHLGRANEKRKEVPKLEQALEQVKQSIEAIKGFNRSAAAQGADIRVGASMGKSAAAYNFDASDDVASLQREIDSLWKDIKDHENKALQFKFLGGSLFGQDYALAWDDLRLLELVK